MKLKFIFLFLFTPLLIAKMPKQLKKDIKSEKQKKMEKVIPKNYIKLDEIKTIVHGPSRSEIFCASDDGMPGIDGQPMSLHKNILWELSFQDAINLKMPLDDAIIKTHLEKTIRGFGLKPGDERRIFAEVGYTYEEGYEQFKKMYAVNSVTDFKVRSDLVITEDQVMKYWKENPIKIEERFCFKTVFIEPMKKQENIIETDKEIAVRINNYLKNNPHAIAWSEPFWMKKNEIAPELESIIHMKVNQIKQLPQRNGIQLYQLVDYEPEKIVSLEERYKEIVSILQKPMYKKKLENYHQELLQGATVIYL